MQVTDAKEKIPTVSQTFHIEKKRIGRQAKQIKLSTFYLGNTGQGSDFNSASPKIRAFNIFQVYQYFLLKLYNTL